MFTKTFFKGLLKVLAITAVTYTASELVNTISGKGKQ